jgi:hypothetical protein
MSHLIALVNASLEHYADVASSFSNFEIIKIVDYLL